MLAFRNPLYRPRASWLLGLLGIYLLVSLSAGFFGVSFQRSLWSTFERMQGIVDLAHWLVLIVVLSGVIRDGDTDAQIHIEEVAPSGAITNYP